MPSTSPGRGNGNGCTSAGPDYKMYEYVCEDNREYADPVTGKARLRIDDK